MTEKDYNPEQKQAKAMKKQQKAAKQKITETPKKTEKKVEEKKQTQEEQQVKNVESKETAKEEVKKTEKKTQPEKPKKTEAFVTRNNAPLSTKQCVAVCRFIVGKRIEKAIEDLEDVIQKRKAVPMKGEIPHRKGKGMMSGRYPKNASKYFIKLLKTLSANSIVNGLEDPVIAEAIANIGSRPYGRFGSQRRKRSNIKIISKDKSKLGKKK